MAGAAGAEEAASSELSEYSGDEEAGAGKMVPTWYPPGADAAGDTAVVSEGL